VGCSTGGRDHRPEARPHVGRAYDSARWAGFDPRPDDIIISTPPKCGTTWTQMICALLVLQTPELPDRLSNLSPWLDMLTRSRKEVVALLEAQAHRRFIKTHTPLPGIPLREGVTYICVGRDPRDVALSRVDHLANMDWDAFHVQRVAAARDDALPEPEKITPPPLDQSTDRDRFWRWVDDDKPPEEAGSSLLRTLRHIESFWGARDTVNVVMLHYHDLKTNLDGQMRALAARLGIDVPNRRWGTLVEAATFASMRRDSARTVPNMGIWKEQDGFFKRARSGAWRDLLDDDDQRRYEDRVASLIAPDLATWLHRS
jgi:aryl sulfotransferase